MLYAVLNLDQLKPLKGPRPHPDAQDLGQIFIFYPAFAPLCVEAVLHTQTTPEPASDGSVDQCAGLR